MYQLIWQGEVIEDDIETLQEALYLQLEYVLAYGGLVRVIHIKAWNDKAIVDNKE